MSRKFRVGDKVDGLPEADIEYNITAPKWGFVGKVVKIDTDGTMALEVIQIKDEKKYTLGRHYWVNQEYFKLLESIIESEADEL